MARYEDETWHRVDGQLDVVYGRVLIVYVTAAHGAYSNQGPANHSNEFVVSLDDLTQHDTDIDLSNRYALNIHFQWLWYSREDVDMIASETPGKIQAPLTPWVLCKYRF